MIWITGIGEFAQYGTDEQVEDVRTWWEGGCGTKKRIAADHPAAAAEIARMQGAS